jgi:hypothetical protein
MFSSFSHKTIATLLWTVVLAQSAFGATVTAVQTQSIAQNDVIANTWFQQANDRLVPFTVSSGNVGIGIASPTRKLHVQDGVILVDWTDPRIAFYGPDINYAVYRNGTSMFLNSSGYSYLSAAAGVGLMTNSITRLFVDVSGNVGIWTWSPSAKLEVAGQVKINDGTQWAGKVLTSDANGLASWQTAGGGGSSQWTTDGSNIYYNWWNVGLGLATTPEFALHIKSNSFFGSVIALHDPTNPYTWSPKWSISFRDSNNSEYAYFGSVTWKNAVGLYSWKPIWFNVNGATTLMLNASGNVGVGTETPWAKLEVAGQVKITGGSPWAGKVLTSDANGLATWQTPSGGSSSQWTTNGSNISFTWSNVGIWTSSITAKLDVKGGSFQVIDSTNFDAWKTAIIRWYGNFYSNGSAVTSSVFDATLDSEVWWLNGDSQAIKWTANCMWNTNGHCWSLYGWHFILNDKSPDNSNNRYLYDGAGIFAEYTNNSVEPSRSAWYSSLSAGKFVFKNLTSVTIPEKAMWVQVATPINSAAGTINNYYGVYVDNVNVSWITNKYAFYYNGSSPFVVTGNGDMGVGIITPSYKLHVNWTAWGTSWTNTSDMRLKKNIETLPASSLETLSLVRPVSFDWKDSKDEYMKTRQYGFIAQEVEKVYPNLVTTANDEMKTKSVNYDGFIPLLVSSVQELQKENAELRARIEKLENRK